MLYFCVNNNYHLDFERQIIDSFSDCKTLIQVPFSLDLNDTDSYDNIIKFDYNNSISLRRLIFKITELKTIINEISSQLAITKADTLFIHTDNVIVNAIIIELFAKYHARIVLLEDGTATMCDYNEIPSKTPCIDAIRGFILRHIYGLRNTFVVSYRGDKRLRLDDTLFHYLIVSWGNKTLRQIPLINIGIGEISRRRYTSSGAIFFNQAMYLFICTEQEYLEIISQMLRLSITFNPFYFKFHPHDTQTMQESIRNLIRDYFPSVKILEEKMTAEQIVDKYDVKYSVSYASTSTLNHIKKGLVPIFLADVFDQIKPTGVHDEFKTFLNIIGCQYPKSLEQVGSEYYSLEKLIKDDQLMNRSDLLKDLLR